MGALLCKPASWRTCNPTQINTQSPEYAENIALDAEISSSSSSGLTDINDGVAESTIGTLYKG